MNMAATFPKCMKVVLALAGLILGMALFGGTAHAGDPVHLEAEGFGAYGVRYVGVTASSTTAGVIPAMGNDGWREVACVASDNGSTTTILSGVSSAAITAATLRTAGSRFPFTASLGRRWNTGKAIYFAVPAGSSDVALDCEIWTAR